MSVESILEDYKASSNALAKGELSENTIAEVVDGIKDFFDAFCGKYLLYNVERTQYEQFFKSTESTDQRGSKHIKHACGMVAGRSQEGHNQSNTFRMGR